MRDITNFNTLKLIYLYYKYQLALKIKDIFTTNESVNPYNSTEVESYFLYHRLIRLIML